MNREAYFSPLALKLVPSGRPTVVEFGPYRLKRVGWQVVGDMVVGDGLVECTPPEGAPSSFNQ